MNYFLIGLGSVIVIWMVFHIIGYISSKIFDTITKQDTAYLFEWNNAFVGMLISSFGTLIFVALYLFGMVIYNTFAGK